MKFSAAQWVFSLKLFIAAMLAYVVSVHMGLPQNYWAVVTCVVVMNPTTGGVRSKAVYRFTGTLCAGVVGLLLASAFGSQPLFIIVCTGLVATTAFGWALLDRTPSAYGFQLFGITLMLIAVGGIDHPEHMFDTAIGRICEIGLGIVCCSVVDSIIAPRSLSKTLRQRLNVWLPDMETWIADTFQGHIGDRKAIYDRLKIIADVSAMSVLAVQVRYDPTISKWERQCVFAIQQKLLRLIPMLSAIAAYIAARHPANEDVVAPWLQDALERAREGRFSDDGLVEKIEESASHADTADAWNSLLHENLAELMSDALHSWSEIKQIDAALISGRPLSAGLETSVRRAKAFPLQPDFHVASRVAGGILLAYSLLCGIWWATGWSYGPNAVLMGMVAAAFFGNLDEAGKAITTFARFSVMALLLAGFLSYGLLPLAHDFPSFVMVMGVVMLPLGAWAAINPFAILLLALALSNINLQAQYSPLGFDAFVESSLSTLLGVYVAFINVGLVRRMGAAHTVQRYAKMQRAEIIALTRRAKPRDRDNYTNRALDRIAGVIIRQGMTDSSDQGTRLLSWLRAGVAVANIQQASAQRGGAVRRASEALLVTVRQEVNNDEPSAALLLRIDQALWAAWKGRREISRPLIRGLIGLRLALFEGAKAWEPKSPGPFGNER